jgi:hypothetical protein
MTGSCQASAYGKADYSTSIRLVAAFSEPETYAMMLTGFAYLMG